MILHCTFEELAAIDAAIERVRHPSGTGGVAAPPAVLPDLEALAPRLIGDLAIETLDDQQSVQRALEFLVADTRERTDSFILDQHPAAEDAVLAYFEYAHILTVLGKIRHIGGEMRAIIELMTGRAPKDDE
ncbi:MAG: hypothetical protein L0271_01545, partial [Gemmatimonadetes bacterium]|nr:hypothetical protein [Gemmatimonadota bacterium]